MGLFGDCIGKRRTFATAIERQKAVRRLDVPRAQKQIKHQLFKKSIMIELYLTQNNNSKNEAYGKHYPRVSYKQTLNIHDMAVHIAESEKTPHYLCYYNYFH